VSVVFSRKKSKKKLKKKIKKKPRADMWHTLNAPSMMP